MRDRLDFKRDIRFKDFHKIIVIAFEGAEDKAEDRYFEGIQSILDKKTIDKSFKVYIHSIPNKNNLSAPSHIFENLNEFNTDDLDLDFKEDKSFLLVDFDRHLPNIIKHDIENKCKNGNIKLIICRPCFELWLLLHFEDVSSLDEDNKKLLLKNAKVSTEGKPINNRLTEACGSANKRNLNFETYKDNILQAIENTLKLDNSNNVIPDCLSARVDKILTEVGI
jgi:hypothetical protein